MASIRKRPNGKWRARYRDPDGREHARHFARKVDAQRWLDETTTDLVTGRYVDPSAGQVTFRDYAQRWLTGQPHRPSTASLYERLLRLHVFPVFGDRALASIKRSDVQGWVAAFSETHAPETVHGTYARVRTIFLAAVEDRVLAESPCRRIALPEKHDEKVVPLTIAEVRRLIEAAPDDLRALIVFAAATGLRSGELLGLTVDRVNFLRREVEVAQQLVYITGQEPMIGPPKTKASRRVVPVPAFALDELAEHLRRWPAEPGELVFRSSKGRPILRTTLNGRWRRTVERAGLPAGTRLHHLRHHYASVLIDGGESVKVVQERLGHASAVETLRTYSHLFPSSDERTRMVVESAWNDAPAEHMRNVSP